MEKRKVIPSGRGQLVNTEKMTEVENHHWQISEQKVDIKQGIYVVSKYIPQVTY